jgi:hypothetical protein
MSDTAEFKRGEIDGRKDGAAGVKPVTASILARIYSRAYGDGYRSGYERAVSARTAERGKVA